MGSEASCQELSQDPIGPSQSSPSSYILYDLGAISEGKLFLAGIRWIKESFPLKCCDLLRCSAKGGIELYPIRRVVSTVTIGGFTGGGHRVICIGQGSRGSENGISGSLIGVTKV